MDETIPKSTSGFEEIVFIHHMLFIDINVPNDGGRMMVADEGLPESLNVF